MAGKEWPGNSDGPVQIGRNAYIDKGAIIAESEKPALSRQPGKNMTLDRTGKIGDLIKYLSA